MLPTPIKYHLTRVLALSTSRTTQGNYGHQKEAVSNVFRMESVTWTKGGDPISVWFLPGPIRTHPRLIVMTSVSDEEGQSKTEGFLVNQIVQGFLALSVLLL